MGYRIALADDDPDARIMLTRMLASFGHEVCYAAEDGEDLLSAGLDHAVDLVILDLEMPNLDGLATAEEVSQRGIPVLLISGHADLDSVVVDIEPVARTLAKPVEAAALREALDTVLENRG